MDMRLLHFAPKRNLGLVVDHPESLMFQVKSCVFPTFPDMTPLLTIDMSYSNSLGNRRFCPKNLLLLTYRTLILRDHLTGSLIYLLVIRDFVLIW